ncbi:MAG TPA: hypothetical protein VM493_00915, partial [Vicinamibacterales bacterium]|nr:hypothetical protein [Vicinamibacterales bacterium]
VDRPEDWPWSSYLVHVGKAPPLAWLGSETLRAFVLGRSPRGAADRQTAIQQYTEWVNAGLGKRLWDEALRQQIYLGDDAFVERMQAEANPVRRASADIPSVQSNRPWSLRQWFASSRSTPEAVWRAHVEGGLSMSNMAKEMGRSVSSISRMIRLAELQVGRENRIDASPLQLNDHHADPADSSAPLG